MKDLLERFIEKIAGYPDTAGCWVWKAYINSDGYGKFNVNGKSEFAHRISYQLFEGPISDSLEVDHKCRNRNCVNPSHLELVTHIVNVVRGDNYSKGWEREITHCPKGHEYNTENTIIYNNKRKCKTCHRERARIYRLALRSS